MRPGCAKHTSWGPGIKESLNPRHQLQGDPKTEINSVSGAPLWGLDGPAASVMEMGVLSPNAPEETG